MSFSAKPELDSVRYGNHHSLPFEFKVELSMIIFTHHMTGSLGSVLSIHFNLMREGADGTTGFPMRRRIGGREGQPWGIDLAFL